jgi:ferrous iron transport protein A
MMMPLTMAPVGQASKIQRVGGNDETKRFLANLGFVVGSEVTVISAIGGNVIVNIKDSRVAINQDMAPSHHGSVSFP